MADSASHTSIPIAPKGQHSRMYERPNPSGVGRQVVKESVPWADLKRPQMFADRSRLAIRNEYLAIQYIRQHTTIPVPNIVEFRDEPGSPVQIVMEFVENALPPQMIRLSQDARNRMKDQILNFTQQLHSLTDSNCRSFAGVPLFGLRFERTHIPIQTLNYRQYDTTDSPYVLCHGDLAWHNILLDTETHEIKCLLDWEFAGFYPVESEGEYWKRRGPLGRGRKDEKCDIDQLIRILWSHREGIEVERVDGSKEPSSEIINQAGGEGSDLHVLLQSVHIPVNSTVSVGTILSHGLQISRKKLGDGLQDLSRCLDTDASITSKILSEVSAFDIGIPKNKVSDIVADTYPMRMLDFFLPKAFSTFATDLESSASPFLPLADHFSTEANIAVKLERMGELHTLPDTAESTKEDVLIQCEREMKGERRNLADEAYRASEVQKWTAIKKFATELLRLSAAAESLFPYLADREQEHVPPESSMDRAWTEYRVQNVVRHGGTGCWEAKTEDSKDALGLMREEFEKDWEGQTEKREKLIKFRSMVRKEDDYRYDIQTKQKRNAREKSKVKSENGGMSPPRMVKGQRPPEV